MDQQQQNTSTLEEIQTMLRTMEASINSLTQRVNALAVSAQDPALPPEAANQPQEDTPLEPAPDPARRRPLPMGEPFSGNKASFKAWLVTIKHKLATDRDFPVSLR